MEFDREKLVRIVNAAEQQPDWKAAVEANGVSWRTAYNWIRRPDEQPRRRGGAICTFVCDGIVIKMVEYVDANPQATLVKIKHMLNHDFNT